jgi:hypothetical protein
MCDNNVSNNVSNLVVLIKLDEQTKIENPYLYGTSWRTDVLVQRVEGTVRRRLLRLFRDGYAPDWAEYWHAPINGGAFRVTDPNDVDWAGMR